MKTIILSIAALLVFGLVNAQPRNEEARKGERPSPTKEEVMKTVGTDEETAAKLLTIHEEMRAEMNKLKDQNRSTFERLKAGDESMSDGEYEKLERLKFQSDRERIDIKEKYYDRYLDIIPASDVSKFMSMVRRPHNDEMRHQKRMHHKTDAIPIDKRD